MDSPQEDDDEDMEHGEDGDEIFREDTEAVKRALMLTGVGAVCNSDDESEEVRDLDFVQSIRKKFCLPMDVEVQRQGGISDLDEVDVETLKSIRRRFSNYDSDEMKRKFASCRQENDFASNTGNVLESVPLEDVGESKESLELGACSNILSPRPYHQNLVILNQIGDSTGDNGTRETSSLSVTPPRKGAFCYSGRVFMEALKKNRICQKLIRIKLLHVEAMIVKNKEFTNRMKCLYDFQRSCQRQSTRLLAQEIDARVRLISLPNASKSSKETKDDKLCPVNFGPLENSHVSIFRKVHSKFPSTLKKKIWSAEEAENLMKGIKQQVQEFLFRNSMEKFREQEKSVPQPNCLDTVIEEIKRVNITPLHIRSFLPQINWNRLASMYVKNRSGVECHARWLSIQDPLINWSPWTRSEDKKLLFIVQQSGPYNWIRIADILKTHRTASQCLSRYQRSLNANILNSSWTEEEDDQLRVAVQLYGEKTWQLVASHLQGRSGVQCSNRWRKILHPSRQKVGRWTVDEDKRLKVAVMFFGQKNWKKVSGFIPGRTQVQCRDRWIHSLDPSLKLEEWTEEEDLKLKAALTEHGHYKWSKVAACVPPRTGGQCRRRWKVLFPHELHESQMAQKIKRSALISNFVYRGKDRPAIGPEDFLPCEDLTLMVNCKKANNEKPGRGQRHSKLKRNLRDVPTSDNPQPVFFKRRSEKCAEGTNGNSEEADGDAVSASKLHKKVKRKKFGSASNIVIACQELNTEEAAEGDETLLAFNQNRNFEVTNENFEAASVSMLRKKVNRNKVNSANGIFACEGQDGELLEAACGDETSMSFNLNEKVKKRKGKKSRKGIVPQILDPCHGEIASYPRPSHPGKDDANPDSMNNLLDVSNSDPNGGAASIHSTLHKKNRKRKVKIVEKNVVSRKALTWESANDPNEEHIHLRAAATEPITVKNLQDVPSANSKALKVQVADKIQSLRKLKQHIRMQCNGAVVGSDISESTRSYCRNNILSIQRTSDTRCESYYGLSEKAVPEQQSDPKSVGEKSSCDVVRSTETGSLSRREKNLDEEAIEFSHHGGNATINFIVRAKSSSQPAEENVANATSGEVSNVRMIDKGSCLDSRSIHSALSPFSSDQLMNGSVEPSSTRDVRVQVSDNTPSKTKLIMEARDDATDSLGREEVEDLSSEGNQASGNQKQPEKEISVILDPNGMAHNKVDMEIHVENQEE